MCPQHKKRQMKAFSSRAVGWVQVVQKYSSHTDEASVLGGWGAENIFCQWVYRDDCHRRSIKTVNSFIQNSGSDHKRVTSAWFLLMHHHRIIYQEFLVQLTSVQEILFPSCFREDRASAQTGWTLTWTFLWFSQKASWSRLTRHQWKECAKCQKPTEPVAPGLRMERHSRYVERHCWPITAFSSLYARFSRNP